MSAPGARRLRVRLERAPNSCGHCLAGSGAHAQQLRAKLTLDAVDELGARLHQRVSLRQQHLALSASPTLHNLRLLSS